MDGLRAQYQRLQATAAGGTVARIQVDAAEDVDRIPCDQAQRIQRRCAGGIIAAQQLLQHGLVHGHAIWQRPCGRRLRDRLGGAEVERRHAHAKLARAITGGIAHLQHTIGGHPDAAIGHQPCLAFAVVLAAADVDRDRPGRHTGRTGDQVQALVRDGQQAAIDLIGHGRRGRAVACERQGVECRPGFDQDAAATGRRSHQYLRCLQGRTGADRHIAHRAGHRHQRSRLVELSADHHAFRPQRIECVVGEGRAAIVRLRRTAGSSDLQRTHGRAGERGDQGTAASLFIGRGETRRAGEVDGRGSLATSAFTQCQGQAQRIDGLPAARLATTVGGGLHEAVVAGFVVAGMPAYHRRRRQQDIGEQRRRHPAQCRSLPAGHAPGTGAGLDRLWHAGGPRRAQLDAECTRLQREARRQQCVGARRQAGNAGGYGDLLAHRWSSEAIITAGCEAAGTSRHDRVHRVAGGTERIARVGIGQRGAQHVDGATAA